MKKIFLLILSSIFICSCEEVIDIDFDSVAPRLVIDAHIDRIIDVDTQESEDVVLVNLTLTTDVNFDGEIYVDDAEVIITDLTNNIVYPLNTNNNGRYSITNDNFIIENDVEYKLSVTHENQTYESTQVLLPSSPIEYLIQFKDTSQFRDEEEDADDVAFKIVYRDRIGEGDYYTISINDMNFVTAQDTFIIDGDPFDFDYFYEDPPSNILEVFIYGSNATTNNYIDGITFLSEGSGNGIFSTVPYELRGNIINTTNVENYPYGYFRVNEVYKKAIILVDNDEAPTLEEVEQIIEDDQQNNQ